MKKFTKDNLLKLIDQIVGCLDSISYEEMSVADQMIADLLVDESFGKFDKECFVRKEN